MTALEFGPLTGSTTARTTAFRDGSAQEQPTLLRDLHQWNPEAADRLARALMAMPAVGSDFFDFQLSAQLGYGAFARVYLARQREKLANRHVVVKVSADFWGEAHTLAQ
jgi:hypothetical protein